MAEVVVRRTYRKGSTPIDFDALEKFIRENKSRLSGEMVEDGKMTDGTDFIVYHITVSPK